MWRKSKVFGLLTIVFLIALSAGGFTLLTRSAASAPVSGTVAATAVDRDGLPVRGNCFRLQNTTYNQQRCDALDGVVDGRATFTNVPFGAYTLSQSYTPVGFAPPSPNGVAVDVPDGTPVAATLTSSRTDLQVTLRDDADQLVLGACFNVVSGSYSRTVCDNAANSDGSNGVTLIDYVPSGDVALTQTSGPVTHDLMPVTSVTISGGALNTTVQTTTLRGTVDFAVSSADQDGKPVRGACWSIDGVGALCDARDGVVDGSAIYPAVPVGANLTLRQVYTPIGFAPPSPPSAIVTTTVAGPNAFVFTSPRTDLEVTLLDQNEEPVLGACFTVSSGNYTRGSFCDASVNSGGTDGVTLLDYVPGGPITLTQDRGPEGSALLVPQPVSVTLGVRNVLTLHTTAPAKVTVSLASVDQDAGPTRGACFSLTRGSFSTFRCDSQDGTVDGRASFANVPALTGYALRQTYTPIGFAAPATNPVTMDVTELGPNVYIFTSNRTDLEITLVDIDGNPVLGACFSFTSGSYVRTACDSAATSGGLNGVTLVTYSPAPVATVALTNTVPGSDQPAAVTYTDLGAGVLNRRVVVTSGAARLTLETVAKDASGVVISAADQGDVVTFETVARNTSVNVAQGVLITGTLGGMCGPVDLAPNDGAESGPDELVCAATYTVTRDDRRAGTRVVSASATAGNVAEATATTSLTVRQASATAVVQVFEDAARQIPATGTYQPDAVFYLTVTVTNSGPSALTNVSVWSEWGFAGYVPRLSTGESADVYVDWASITPVPFMGATEGSLGAILVWADQLDSWVSTPAFTVPIHPWGVGVTLALYWDAGRTQPVIGGLGEGDTVYIEATATNTGAVTLRNATVDVYWQTLGWYGFGSCYLPSELLPGETVTCLIDQTATIDEFHVQTGSISIVNSLRSQFSSVYFEDSTFPVIPPVATLSIAVTDGAGNPVAEGATVNLGWLTITYTVNNQGPGRLDDVRVTGDGLLPGGCWVGTLTAGASGTCTGSYEVSGVSGPFKLSGAANARQLLAPATAEFDLVANRRPTFVTNPVVILATGRSESLPDSLLTLSGATDPEGTPVHMHAGSFNGSAYQNWMNVGAEGFGSYILNVNVDTTFQLLVLDADGRMATLTVVVDADTDAPVVTTSGDQTLEATSFLGEQVFFSATATDDRTSPAVTCRALGSDFTSGSILPMGIGTVTCTATDNAGNTGSASFTVTIQDTTPPVVTTSGNQTLEATSPAGAPVHFTATASDAVSFYLTVNCSLDNAMPIASGDLAPLGHHGVRCTSIDWAGNVGEASFTVDVVDTIPPEFTVTPDQVVVQPGDSITFTVTLLDAVTPGPMLVCWADGAFYPPFDPRVGIAIPDPGIYAFTCSASDDAMNVASGSGGAVRVNAPPVAWGDWAAIAVQATSGPLPDSIMTLAMVEDLDGDPVAIVAGTYAGDGQPENTLTLDTAGNGSFTLATNVDTVFLVVARDSFGAEVTFHVVIDADTDAPLVLITAPETSEAWGPEGGPIVFTVQVFDDRSVILSASCTLDGAGPVEPFIFAPVGAHTLACSATDDAGNIGVASATVTVYETSPAAADTGPILPVAAAGGVLTHRRGPVGTESGSVAIRRVWSPLLVQATTPA